MGNKKEVAKQCWWQLSESEHQRDQITELSSLILESINSKKNERKKERHAHHYTESKYASTHAVLSEKV